MDPNSTSTPPQDKPRSEATQPHSDTQESTTGAKISATDRVASLTLDELRTAHRLYTKRMQKDFSAKGVAKRQRTMQLNLREIVDFLSIQNGSPLPRIAKHTNITPGTTSKYLRQLIASGKVHATGWDKTRRYYLK